MTKNTVEKVLESLTDAISEAKAKANSPWLIVAGDWNHYDVSIVSKTYPDLIKRQTGPTRGDAVLDYSFTNFEQMIERSEVCFPIESTNSKSDHCLIVYESRLNRPATFAWETHEYIKLTEEVTQKFGDLIRNESWNSVLELAPDPDKMVSEFQAILDRYVSSCYSWKRIRRKSNDAPWLSLIHI